MTQTAPRIYVFVGTYTTPMGGLQQASGNGIHVYTFDAEQGTLTASSVQENIDNPSYLAFSPDKTHLYAVSELVEGEVVAFAFDRETSLLTPINKQPTQGSEPAHLSVEATGRYALVTNYGAAAVSKGALMYSINGDGSLNPPSSIIEHQGSGPNAARQDRSHCHQIVPDPANRFAYVVDLGIDKVMIYRMDLENGQLVPNAIPSLDVPSGSGPRHMTFHPNGRFAYVVTELSNMVFTLSVNLETGALDIMQSLPLLPEDFSEVSYASAVQISHDGRFLYAANRLHDSITIFAVDKATGQLTLAGHHSTGGQYPRDFTLDPTGRFVLASNQRSDSLVLFRVNPDTGLLEDTGQTTTVGTPVCVKMIQV
jgi:6-phosphogluconolactonase